MKTVVAVMPSLADARHVAGHLSKIGVATKNVCVVRGAGASEHDLKVIDRAKCTSREALAQGAVKGGIFCGVVSVMMMSVPGVTPFLQGSLLATLSAAAVIGVVFGGLIGMFHNMALTREEVPLYAEAMREGGVAVAAHMREELETPAIDILREHKARKVCAGKDAWIASGWPGAYENKHPDPCDSALTSF